MKAFLYRACAIIFSHFVLYPDYRISFFIPLAFRFADYNREGASVSYTLPATFVSASLQIFDVTGKPVKVIKLDNGSSNVVEVSRSELGYGTFIYTLFVDGKKADTLKKYVSL